MRKTKKALFVVVLVVIMPIIGTSQTNNITFERVDKENNFLCTSDSNIKEIFISGKIDWCKIENTEDQKYIKKCLLTSDNHSFSEVLLTSEVFEDSSKKRVNCVYIEVHYYDNTVLYVKKANESVWWQATNILNLQ